MRAARRAADGRLGLQAPPIARTMVRCTAPGVRAIIVACGSRKAPRVSARRRGRAQQKETRRVGSRGAGRCPGRSVSSPGAGTAHAPPRLLSPPFGSAAARFVVSHLVSACLGLSRLISAYLGFFGKKSWRTSEIRRRHSRMFVICSAWGGHAYGRQGSIARCVAEARRGGGWRAGLERIRSTRKHSDSLSLTAAGRRAIPRAYRRDDQRLREGAAFAAGRYRGLERVRQSRTRSSSGRSRRSAC